MIYGYYHLNMRTIDNDNVSELKLGDAKVSEKVRVAHTLWGPLFPLGKYWMKEQQGQMYSTNKEATSLLNQRFGKEKSPWYAYLGLIALGIMILLPKIASMISTFFIN